MKATRAGWRLGITGVCWIEEVEGAGGKGGGGGGGPLRLKEVTGC